MLLPLALAGLVPLASTVTLGQLNGAVFAGRFGDGPFVNRLSGVFLMGVFSPALTADDIRAAGVAVSDDEVARMQLGNDDERIDQVWGTQDFWLRRVVARRLHATGEYDRRVDRAARRMVVAGVTRHPLDFARVYLRSLAEQFSPARWRLHLEGELGLERPLDAWVVADVNRYAARPISPGITHRITLVPRLLRWSVGAYPVLLGLGLLVAAIALLGPAAPSARLPAASLVVSFLAAPLYGKLRHPALPARLGDVHLAAAAAGRPSPRRLGRDRVDTSRRDGEMTARASAGRAGHSSMGGRERRCLRSPTMPA